MPCHVCWPKGKLCYLAESHFTSAPHMTPLCYKEPLPASISYNTFLLTCSMSQSAHHTQDILLLHAMCCGVAATLIASVLYYCACVLTTMPRCTSHLGTSSGMHLDFVVLSCVQSDPGCTRQIHLTSLVLGCWYDSSIPEHLLSLYLLFAAVMWPCHAHKARPLILTPRGQTHMAS